MSIYFDHAASAPLRDSARDAWISASALVGNASSVHGAGQAARRLLEGSRERIAAVLDCDPIEVVLTSGGTESANLALKGLWWARPADTGAIVLPDGEHHATLDAVGWLRSQGAAVRPVGLDDVGRIRQEDFRDALTAPEPAAVATALVANNEVGTVQDAAALAGAAAAAGVALHLDAVGALGHVPVSFSAWRADASGAGGLVALSISGHKVGAPVGTGALVVSRHARLSPLVHGGGLPSHEVSGEGVDERRHIGVGDEILGRSFLAYGALAEAAEARKDFSSGSLVEDGGKGRRVAGGKAHGDLLDRCQTGGRVLSKAGLAAAKTSSQRTSAGCVCRQSPPKRRSR